MLLRTTIAFLLTYTAMPAIAQETTTKLNLWVFGEVTEKSVDKEMLKAARKLGYDIRIREMTEAKFDEAIAEAKKRPSQLPEFVAGFRRSENMPTGFYRCRGFLQGISSGDHVPFVGLLADSANHEAAMNLALSRVGRPAAYPVAWVYEETRLPRNGYAKDRKTRLRLMQLARKASGACVTRDHEALAKLWHKDALAPQQKKEPEPDYMQSRELMGMNVSYINGNSRFAVAWGLAGFRSSAKVPQESRRIGCSPVLSIWRKQADEWRLMFVTEDPVSGTQLQKVAKQVNQLTNEPSNSPPAVKLLAPQDGAKPKPAAGRFDGDFVWETSSKPFLEIVEFDYGWGTRMIANPGSKVSSGELWTTRTRWLWRVWSISRDGSVSFSEARTFRD